MLGLLAQTSPSRGNKKSCHILAETMRGNSLGGYSNFWCTDGDKMQRPSCSLRQELAYFRAVPPVGKATQLFVLCLVRVVIRVVLSRPSFLYGTWKVHDCTAVTSDGVYQNSGQLLLPPSLTTSPVRSTQVQ